MDYSMLGFPTHHQLLELAQIHVHQIGDAIQSFYPLPPTSPFLQTFPASGSFPMSWLFASDGQIITFLFYFFCFVYFLIYLIGG